MPDSMDYNIKELVRESLAEKMQLSAMDINITQRDDTIVLTGMVDTLAEKAFAEKTTREIDDVKAVENDLTIATDGSLSDREVQSHVEQHLRESEFSEELANVGVKVEGGSAVLMGEVNTLADKNKAMEEAQKAAGLKDISSRIEIVSQGEFTEYTDDKITSKIAHVLSATPVSVKDMDIRTHQGIVTLRGYVDDSMMAEMAIELTADVEGVQKVHSMLKVRGKDE